MIIRACCCCQASLGPPIDDGKAEISVSHGYCESCGAAAMSNMESQFAELPADRAREVGL